MAWCSVKTQGKLYIYPYDLLNVMRDGLLTENVTKNGSELAMQLLNIFLII
jgi:hypothetical protein